MDDVVTHDVRGPGAAAVTDGAIIDSGEHVVVAQNTPLLARCFLAKPLSVVHAEESEGVLERSLGFWDLFALGFGGTVGRCVAVCFASCRVHLVRAVALRHRRPFLRGLLSSEGFRRRLSYEAVFVCPRV